MKHSKLAIIGAGGHGRVVADIAFAAGEYRSILFFDDTPPNSGFPYPIAGAVCDAEKMAEECDFIIAIGENATRQRLQERFEYIGAELTVLVHPSAVIGRRVVLGAGSVVAAGSVINCDTSIGRGCIVNTGAALDHDDVLGDFVHISPGAHLGGAVRVGSRCWIGLGSGVINNCSIPGDCIIGGGAFVCESLKETGTYVGVPARRREG